MNKSCETISREVVFSGKILDVYLDQIRLENGRPAEREVIEHGGGVVALALVDGEVLLVRQYRHPAGQSLLELPAGKLEKGENPAVCAARELEEETGYKPESVRELGRFYATPGYSSEIFYLYAAENLTRTRQNLDTDEILEIERLRLDDAIAACADGRIKDAKTALALLLYQLTMDN
ncbi:MAG: NUDIX hydrolase [Oscillospiraceae bacterium]|nr:NUDIX hydrolase [Oscillospiraceae bacterium]